MRYINRLFTYLLTYLPSHLHQLICASSPVPSVPSQLYHLICTSSSVPSHLYHLTCTISSVPAHLYHLTCTSSSVPSHLYQLTCTSSSVPTHLYHLTCTSSPVPTHLHQLICTRQTSLGGESEMTQFDRSDKQLGLGKGIAVLPSSNTSSAASKCVKFIFDQCGREM